MCEAMRQGSKEEPHRPQLQIVGDSSQEREEMNREGWTARRIIG